MLRLADQGIKRSAGRPKGVRAKKTPLRNILCLIGIVFMAGFLDGSHAYSDPGSVNHLLSEGYVVGPFVLLTVLLLVSDGGIQSASPCVVRGGIFSPACIEEQCPEVVTVFPFSTLVSCVPKLQKAQPVEPNPATADTRDSAPSQESLEDIREQAEQAQRELIEAKVMHAQTFGARMTGQRVRRQRGGGWG